MRGRAQGLEDTLWDRGDAHNLTGAGPGQFQEFASLSAAIDALNVRNRRAHHLRDPQRDNQGQGSDVLPAAENLHVFAREVNSKGARVFLVAEPSVFWEKYAALKHTPHCRHYYEILLDSEPCRLYMDLEFKINSPHNTTSRVSTPAAADLADPAKAAEEEASVLAAAVATGNRLVAELRAAMGPFLQDAFATGVARRLEDARAGRVRVTDISSSVGQGSSAGGSSGGSVGGALNQTYILEKETCGNAGVGGRGELAVSMATGGRAGDEGREAVCDGAGEAEEAGGSRGGEVVDCDTLLRCVGDDCLRVPFVCVRARACARAYES